VPAEPEYRGKKGKPGGSVRPMAGPVVPLTGANVGSEHVLLGGPSASPGATVGLSTGDAVAAPSGRADDFGWPRRVAKGGPAAADEATPHAAESVAGAKSDQRKSAMDAYAAQTGRQQKPAQGRPRSRLNHNAWAHQPSNFPSFGSSGW